VSGFRVFALDDTGRDVEVPNDLTEETTMQPSALAMAVGELCRPGGLTEENRARVEEAILAPRRDGNIAGARTCLCGKRTLVGYSAYLDGPGETLHLRRKCEIEPERAPRLFQEGKSCTCAVYGEAGSGDPRACAFCGGDMHTRKIADQAKAKAEREQAIRLAREALALAERRVMECEVALYEAEGRGDAPYARMRRAQLDGDAAADRAASIEFWADAHETNGTPPPPSLADAVTTLIAKRRTERSITE
jgi:hypothetical protein